MEGERAPCELIINDLGAKDMCLYQSCLWTYCSGDKGRSAITLESYNPIGANFADSLTVDDSA